MKKIKKGLMMVMMGLCLSLMSTVSGYAVPADMEIGGYKQPSGQQFEAQIVGDEYLNYVIANRTGDLISIGEDDYWYYSQLNKQTKTTEPSQSKYLIDERPANSLTVNDIDKLNKNESLKQESRTTKAATKWNKNQNLLVVLIEFNDMELKYSDAEWENRIFSQTSKSLVTYYKEATNDKINIVPAKETYGKQDGIVRIKLDQDHPKVFNNFSKVLPSLKDALEGIQDLVDISEYDTNKNGRIEPNELHIMSVFAGYEASSANINPSVWGHKWSFGGQEIGYPIVDGIKLNHYTAFGERMGRKNVDHEYQSELGIIAHEFGHDLGLPDLYNSETKIIEHDGKYVSVSDGDGLGRYSLMANGSWAYLEGESSGATPTHLDAYCKVALGIVEPTIVDKTVNINVNHISQADFNLVRVNTANPKEYFLIENRQLTGYDAALKTVIYSLEHGDKPIVASGGVAIYHVNEAYRKNNSPSEQLVTLKEANEGILGHSQLSTARYYSTNNYDGFYYKGMGGHGEQQQTALTKESVPSTALSDGSYSAFDILVNSEASPTMNVTIKGKDAEVTGVSVEPKKVAMKTGTTKQLDAKVIPENAVNKAISWSSSNEAIATISSSGVVTAKKAGTVIVTVTTDEGGKTDTSTITITDPDVPVVDVSVTPSSKELVIGATKQLTATINPDNATNKKVDWSSSDKNIATVSSTGLVTAKAVGTAVIKVTTEDGRKTASTTITVKNTNTGGSFDEAIEMDVNELYDVTINETKEKYYAFKPSSTGEYSFISEGTLDWSGYLYDETKKRIGYNDDGNGNLQFKINTKLEAGKTYYLEVYNRGISGENKIRVYPVVRATELILTTTVTSLKEGEKSQLTGTIAPENTTENEKINWSSNDTRVATVSDTGEIEAKNYGTVTITARSNYSGVRKSTKIQVTSDKEGSSFDKTLPLEPNKITEVTLSEVREKYYTFTPSSDGEYSFVSEGKLDWSAELYDNTKNQLSANRGGNGNNQFNIITKLEAGKTYYLKVHNRGIFGENKIRVYPVVRATELTLTPTVISLKEGEKKQLTGTLTPKNTTENKELIWSSNDNRVATVSEAGEIEAKNYGTVTITAKGRYYGLSKSVTIKVTSDKVGSSFDKSIALDLNKVTDVSLPETKEKYYAFKPSIEGNYSFVSEGTLDWSGYLYDETKNQIGYNDDSNGNRQFKINAKLETGKTYYLKVYNRGVFGENKIRVTLNK